MKHTLILIILALCNVTAQATELTFTDQALRIPVSGLSVEAISYTPQMEEDGVTTPSSWALRAQIDLKRGSDFELSGEAWELDRFRIYKTLTLTVADMQTLLGEDYPAVLFAVQHGEYFPDGEIKEALIGYIIAKITGAE